MSNPVSRRSLFSRFAGTGAAATPFILAAKKALSDPIVVGAGAFQYEAIHNWGELPSNIRFGNTHNVAEDAHGHIYVHFTPHSTSQSGDSIVVFDAKGKFVRSFGKDFRGGAHGLHIRKEGSEEFLYMCDISRALVVKTNLKGEEVYRIGYPNEAAQYKPVNGMPIKFSPTNVAIAPNGDLYVGDGYGSSFVSQYDSKGQWVRTFGGLGKGPGQLDCPHGVWVDTRGASPVLTVADRGNSRIQRFTLDGKHIDFTGGFNMPCHFHEHKGNVVIADLAARVTLLDRDNQVIEHLGDDSKSNWRETRTLGRDKFTPGKFVSPHGACFDRNGNIFVVEWVEVGRVTKLRLVS